MSKKTATKTVLKTVSKESIKRYKPAMVGLLKAIKKNEKSNKKLPKKDRVNFKMSVYLGTLNLTARGWVKATEQCGFISKDGLVYTTNMKAKNVTDETVTEMFLKLRENNQAAEKKRKENAEILAEKTKKPKDKKKSKKDKKKKKSKKGKNKNKSNLSQLMNWFSE